MIWDNMKKIKFEFYYIFLIELNLKAKKIGQFMYCNVLNLILSLI